MLIVVKRVASQTEAPLVVKRVASQTEAPLVALFIYSF